MVEPIADNRRRDTPKVADERGMLDAWLDYHRVTLLLKCEGLDADELAARPVASSLLSLHGLVRHMADVERHWFQRAMERASIEEVPPLFWSDEEPDGDFELRGGEVFAADLATWEGECERARQIAAAYDLDDVGERHGEPVSLRWILVHMIEEYARHNGHADLLREMVDGQVGD